MESIFAIIWISGNRPVFLRLCSEGPLDVVVVFSDVPRFPCVRARAHVSVSVMT